MFERLFTHRIPVVYDPAYRLPLTTIQARSGFDTRRADLVLWFAEEEGLARRDNRRNPTKIPYSDIARVHLPAYLEALSQPETLAEIFALETWDVQVDPLLSAIRLACGGTLLAAREALSRKGPSLNLMGGFHHAHPHRGLGFCALNDIAIAIAVLREEGLKGTIGILDLDAHPPDGTLACKGVMGDVWIGSISGSQFGTLPGVDESFCPQAEDAQYLALLDALLGRMPACVLVFVIAGGDVLAGDPLGCLRLTLPGAWARDRKIAQHLAQLPTVWLPGGGYQEEAWRVLAGTLWILSRRSFPQIPVQLDPLALRFQRVATSIKGEKLGSWEMDLSDLAQDLGLEPAQPTRLLGFYSATGIEYALYRFGILAQLERLGYHNFEVEFLAGEPGERSRVWGSFEHGPTTERDLLMESCLERRQIPSVGNVLFVHWLSLRNPRGAFAAGRPPLPGQEVPGLGMAREAGEVFARMAQRLGLVGVALQPAWFHVAYTARARYHFVDPLIQGRFEALIRDLLPLFGGASGFKLSEATRAIAEKKILMYHGDTCVVYTWQPELMVDAPLPPNPAIQHEREAVRFTRAA